MANAMVPLANLTLGSAQSTVTFSSIPATYRDLRLVINLAMTSGSGMRMQFNSDTAGNYNYVSAAGDGTSTYSGSASSTTDINTVYGSGFNNTLNHNVIIDVLDYSATDKHKSGLLRRNSPSTELSMQAFRWASTSALTSVSVYSAGSTFVAGSTFSLYGVKA